MRWPKHYFVSQVNALSTFHFCWFNRSSRSQFSCCSSSVGSWFTLSSARSVRTSTSSYLRRRLRVFGGVLAAGRTEPRTCVHSFSLLSLKLHSDANYFSEFASKMATWLTGEPTINYKAGHERVIYVPSGFHKFIWWYHVIALIWISEFILACQQFIIGGAVGMWYFTRLGCLSRSWQVVVGHGR